MDPDTNATFILASGSGVRARMIRNAGLNPVIDPADIDERTVERQCRENGLATTDVAARLAETKARAVARRHPGGLVLGADQMLECDGVVFNKPKDMTAAAVNLTQLQGQFHQLISAACLVQDDRLIWQDHATARLRIRPMNDTQIMAYLNKAGDGILSSVGCYRLEDVGSQLFDRIDGDYFTILGLPLLPLLTALRKHPQQPDGLLL